jgi:hypothetical protein
MLSKMLEKPCMLLKTPKGQNLSQSVLDHVQLCVKYAFSKNQGNPKGLEANLKAIIPHLFGDHSKCETRFCGFLRAPQVKYVYRSLPYKCALKDPMLKSVLTELFEPLIHRSHEYSDLGSSQQNEHANKEVMLRAPKSHHYGNSEALDFRVHASAAFINEGRS